MAEGKFGDWMAPETDAAWRAANHEALELGHSWLGTEHLLLGLLRGPADDPAVSLLVERGVTLDRVRAALVRDLAVPGATDDKELLATLGIDLDVVRARIEVSLGPDAIDELYARRRRGGRRLARGPLCGFAMAPRAKLALERARLTAKTGHRSQATSTDLLIGLLDVPDGMAVRLLRGLGIDPDALRTQLRPRAAG
ncbi:MAG: Clp protease N-terminal domain-containing protein [Actinomycetes bacterium]